MAGVRAVGFIIVLASLIAIVGFFVCPSIASVNSQKPPVVFANAAAVPELTKVLQTIAPEYPGAAFAVVGPSGGLWQGAVGVADVEVDAPMSAQTPVSAYSVNKAMTATLAMKLVEAGRLDLDKPIGAFAGIPAQFASITARELLTHTAGVRHYKDDEWLPNARRSCATPVEGLAVFATDPLGPRGVYLYSSFGYVLLSQVLEAASGKSFNGLMTEHVLTSAGMSHASLWQAGLRRPPNGHEKSWGRFSAAPAIDNSCKFGAGAVIASAEDLARFGAALAGGRLVSDASWRSMTANPKNNYGLGWGVGTLADGTPTASHSGSAIGGTSAIVVDLQRGIAVGMVGNADGKNLIPSAKAILTLARASPQI